MPPMPAGSDTGGDVVKKLSRKIFDKELEKLKVELTRLQEWVKQ